MEPCKTFIVLIPLSAVFYAVVLSVRNPVIEGSLKDIFGRLIPPDNTLLFIFEHSNEDCPVAIKETVHPRIIIDIDRPILGEVILNYVFVICTDNPTWLNVALQKIRNLRVYTQKKDPQARYLLISSNTNVENLVRVFFSQQVTNLTVLQRQVNKEDDVSRKTSINSKILKNLNILPRYAVLENIEMLKPEETDTCTP